MMKTVIEMKKMFYVWNSHLREQEALGALAPIASFLSQSFGPSSSFGVETQVTYLYDLNQQRYFLEKHLNQPFRCLKRGKSMFTQTDRKTETMNMIDKEWIYTS